MNHLDALTPRARAAAQAVGLQFGTVETRRELVRAYGETLLVIRKAIDKWWRMRNRPAAAGQETTGTTRARSGGATSPKTMTFKDAIRAVRGRLAFGPLVEDEAKTFAGFATQPVFINW
jgi:hypothetical protein